MSYILQKTERDKLKMFPLYNKHNVGDFPNELDHGKKHCQSLEQILDKHGRRPCSHLHHKMQHSRTDCRGLPNELEGIKTTACTGR